MREISSTGQSTAKKMNTYTRTVGIIVFDQVEVMDFAGPYEVFSLATQIADMHTFDVSLVAQSEGHVTGRNNFTVVPQYTFENCPSPDILIIPGGPGARVEENNETMLNWVRIKANGAEMVASVCTGARVLAKAGLLDGLESTTHWNSIEELRQMAPTAIVHAERRFVDNGKVLTSAGVSAGIDMSLHIVRRLSGDKIAADVAHMMEYKPQSS